MPMNSGERTTANIAALAVVADELVQQQRLRAMLIEAGYEVAICTSPQNLGHYQANAPAIDLWIVDADLDACPESHRDWLLDNSANHLLFNEGPDCARDDPEYNTWTRRMLASIQRHLSVCAEPGGELTETTTEGTARPAPTEPPPVESMPAEPLLVDEARIPAPASAPIELPPELTPTALTMGAGTTGARPELWILVASLGGPVAVKQFLDALPANLPCTFIYAQHIDAEFEGQLARTIGRHSLLPLSCLQHNDRLKAGQVYIAPIKHSIHFTHGGQVKMHNQPWHGPYNPSLDELMTTASEQYPSRVHCIVFSGMAGDGLKGSAAIREHRGEVWSQSVASCIQSAMPRLIADAGMTTLDADPRGLAEHLVRYLAAQANNDNAAAAQSAAVQS